MNTELSVERRGWVPTTLRIIFLLMMLVITMMMMPGTADATGPIKTLIRAWAVVVLLALAVLDHWPRWRCELRLSVTDILVLAFLLLHFISLFAARIWGVALLDIRSMCALVAVYFVISRYHRELPTVRTLIRGVAFCLAAGVLLGLYHKSPWNKLPFQSFNSIGFTHFFSPFGNPNYAAHAIAPTLFLIAWVALTRVSSKTKKETALFIFGVILTAFLAWALIKTKCRASVLGAMLALVLWTGARFFSRTNWSPTRRACAALVPCLLLVAAGVITGMLWLNYRATHEPVIEHALLLRANGYYSTAETFKDSPVFGHGPGGFKIENLRFWTPYDQQWFSEQSRMNDHAHNEPLEFLVDLGIFGLACYLALLFWPMLRMLRWGNELRESDPVKSHLGFALAAALLVFFADGLFGFNLHVPISATVFFVVLGITEGIAPGRSVLRFQSPALVRIGGVIAVLVLFVMAAADQLWYKSERYMQLGRQYARAGRQDVAEKLYKQAYYRAPWNWEALRQIGISRLREGDYIGAIPEVERAEAIHPFYPPTLAALSGIYMRTGLSNPEERADDLSKARDYANELLSICYLKSTGHDTLTRLKSREALTKPMSDEERQALWREVEEHGVMAINNGATAKGPLWQMVARARVMLGDNEGAANALVYAAHETPGEPMVWLFFHELAEKLNGYAVFRNTLDIERARLANAKKKDPKTESLLLFWHGMLLFEQDHNLNGAEKALKKALPQLKPQEKAIAQEALNAIREQRTRSKQK